MAESKSEILLRGQGLSRGFAIEKPLFLNSPTEVITPEKISDDKVEKEIDAYRTAIDKCRLDIQQLQQQMERERILEGAAILEGHLHILGDPLITTDIERKIREVKQNAPYVFQTMVKDYGKRFEKIREPFFRERYKDLKDLSNRILHHLLRKQQIAHSPLVDPVVLIAWEITASEVAEVDPARVKGIISQEGSATSHAAIVARAKGIPFVSNVDVMLIQKQAPEEVILDGETGAVFLNASLETKQHYIVQIEKSPKCASNNTQAVFLHSETVDGYRIKVLGNVDIVDEVELVHQYSGDGIGLIRTEFMFLTNEQFPSEEEQEQVYASMVKSANGLPVTFRTFDVGGDKPIGKQGNFFAGRASMSSRAIRHLLKEKSVLKDQLRAILLASRHGDVKILFPMIASLDDLKNAKELLRECHQEVTDRGIKVPFPKVGCMVEVPSAAIVSDQLAAHSDFLSVGTNDLYQYSLAVDRAHHEMSAIYASTDPSILRLIKYVVGQANKSGISLSVCGEIAADPKMIPLLIGLGVHELSVASRTIVQVRDVIRSSSVTVAAELVESILV
jgi:phosphotransferase system enzyme I (PtsI)